MEHFFQYDFQENILWFDEAIPVNQSAIPVNQSAFVGYTIQPIEGFGIKYDVTKNHHRNIKKRMTEFLIRSRNLAMKTNEPEKERCRRHMISERMRREKQSQSYLGLHSLLPSGTKRDKNSIILVAAKKIEELQSYKEQLERQNSEMEKVLAARESEQQVEQAQINIRVAYPSSGVDSMLEVLRCLKQTGSKTRAIQSNFSTQELSALLWIETKVGAAKVENAVHKTLFEVERKFRSDLPEEYAS